MLSSTANAQVLSGMELEIQEQSEWCWAAVTCAVLNYYGGDWTQCEIAELTRQVSDWAEHDFGDDDCCVVPDGACNYSNENVKPRTAVSKTCSSAMASKTPWKSASSARRSSSRGRRISPRHHAARVLWLRWPLRGRPGHGRRVRPLHGPVAGEGFGMGSYADMVGGSAYDYVWTSTNILSTSPTCTCSTPGDCCDGCRPMNESQACNDGVACTHTDTCIAGRVWGPPTSAMTAMACTYDVCDGAADVRRSTAQRVAMTTTRALRTTPVSTVSARGARSYRAVRSTRTPDLSRGAFLP